MTRAGVPDFRLMDLDARVQGVSIGGAGVVRPAYTPDGLNERLYCVSCKRPWGYVTRDLPPGVVFLCDSCAGQYGPLPLEAVSFRARE